MTRIPIAALLLGAALQAPAAGLEGRWEGRALVPGAPLAVVLDLAGGAGSVTLPGRGVSGAPLRDLRIGADRVDASLAAAIPSFGAAGPPPAIELKVRADGTLAGQFRLGGLAAPLALQRTGEAQVIAAPTGTPISAALAGTWRGRYEMGGYAREVTLTLKAATPATAELVIVGKRTTSVPVDRVVQGPVFVTVDSSEMGLVIEGRYGGGVIEGTMQQGAIEVPLVLRREGAGS